MKKRVLAILMTLAMVLALCPAAGAAGGSQFLGNDAEFQGHYYKIFTESLKWEQARDRCLEMGGHLAVITSAGEQAFVESLNTGNRNLWIGGYRDDSFNWYWVTGEAWTFESWNQGEPNNLGDETCLMMYPRSWNDGNKDSTANFICEWDSLPTFQVRIPNDAVQFQGHYYKIYPNRYS